MKIRSLHISQFYGVGRTEPRIDLQGLGDVNIIYGPNGVGKTVTTRALASLFWPKAEQEARPYLTAEIEDGSEEWKITIEGGHFSCLPSNPPAKPPDGDRSRYFLSLHDLLRAEDGDLAAAIQEEIQGGNLERVATNLKFIRTEPTRNNKEYRDYNEVASVVKTVAEQQVQLFQQEQSLGRLREKLAQAEHAALNLRLYGQLGEAFSLHEGLRKLQDEERVLTESMPGIEQYLESDAEHYRQAKEGIEQCRERQAASAIAITDACKRQEKLFPDTQLPPTGAQLDQWTGQIEDWEKLEQQHEGKLTRQQALQETIAHDEEEARQAAESIAKLRVDAEQLPATLDEETLGLLEQRVKDLEKLQQQLDGMAVQQSQREIKAGQAKERKEQKERELALAREAVEQALHRWGGGIPGAGDIALTEQKVHDLKATSTRLEDERQALLAAETRLDAAARTIGELLSPEQLRTIGQALTAAGMDNLLSKEFEASTLERVLAMLRDLAPEQDASAQAWLEDAIRMLEDWLGTPVVRSVRLPGWWAPAFWAAIMVLAGFAIWSSLAAKWLMIFPLAGGMLLAVLWFLLSRQLTASTLADRQEHERKYAELSSPPSGVEPVSQWEQAVVQARLMDYRRRYAELSAKSALRHDLDVQSRQYEEHHVTVSAEIEQLRKELRALLGIDGPQNATALVTLIHQVIAWQQAAGEWESIAGRVREQEQHYQQQLDAIWQIFAGWGAEQAPVDADDTVRLLADMKAALDDTAAVGQALKTAASELEQAERAFDDLVREIEQNEREKAKILAQTTDIAREIGQRASACLDEAIDAVNAAYWVTVLRNRRKALDELQRKIDEQHKTIGNCRERIERSRTDSLKLDGELAEVARHIDELRDPLATLFISYNEAPVQHTREASRRLQNLRERNNSFKQAATAIETNRKAQVQAEHDEQQRQSSLDALIARLRLEITTDNEVHLRNENRLRALAEKAPEYQRILESRTAARVRYESALEALRKCEGYQSDIEQWDQATLQHEKDTVAREAASIDDIKQTIIQIEHDVEKARRNHNLEDALTRREQAKHQLRMMRDEVVRQNIGATLVEWLGNEGDTRSSEVLRRARRFFSDITAGQYELKVSYKNDKSHFEAIDTRDPQSPRTLDMLSSATRIQLLIAVRLAFLEVQEAGNVRLPLVLDEVLGNSDDVRAEVVVDSILTAIAPDHRRRQLFYFTGQSDEVSKWRSRQQEKANAVWASSLQWEYRPLGAHPMPEQWEYAPEPLLEMTIPLPAEAKDYAEYGRLIPVPAFNPVDDAGNVHLWYLLRQADELHAALRRRVTTLGHIEMLLREGGDGFAARLDISQRNDFTTEVREAIAIIRCVVEIWRDYHGLPVTAEILEKSPFSGSSHLDKIIELSRECHGDSTKLLAGIELIPRVRKAQIEAFEKYLELQGCVPTIGEKLTPQMLCLEINKRMLALDGVPPAETVNTLVMRMGLPLASD